MLLSLSVRENNHLLYIILTYSMLKQSGFVLRYIMYRIEWVE